MGAHGFSVWGGSKKLCENDVKGGTGCSALDIMGDCQGKFAGNHWMTSEGLTHNHLGVIHLSYCDIFVNLFA